MHTCTPITFHRALAVLSWAHSPSGRARVPLPSGWLNRDRKRAHGLSSITAILLSPGCPPLRKSARSLTLTPPTQTSVSGSHPTPPPHSLCLYSKMVWRWLMNHPRAWGPTSFDHTPTTLSLTLNSSVGANSRYWTYSLSKYLCVVTSYLYNPSYTNLLSIPPSFLSPHPPFTYPPFLSHSMNGNGSFLACVSSMLWFRSDVISVLLAGTSPMNTTRPTSGSASSN